MERPDQESEECEVTTAAFQDDFFKETSARTRPFSFHDIMLARKTKGFENRITETEPQGSSIPQLQDEATSKSPKQPSPFNEDSLAIDTKHAEKDTLNESARIKEDSNTSRKNDKHYQDKKPESWGPDLKLKSVVEKKIDDIAEPAKKFRRLRSRTLEKDVFLNDHSVYESHRHSYHVVSKSRVHEMSREKSRRVRRELPNVTKEVLRKRKTGEQMGFDFENERNRSARDRVNSEMERRSKGHNELANVRSTSAGKKRDSEENPAHYEESRPRRRPLHREQVKERVRNLFLHSPKLHKHTSKHKGEHEEPSLLSMKDRPGREHSASENKKISSNGTGSHYRRNSVASSGLGGYSPRKRKTDAAAKTPSPISHSPERRTAGWDLQPPDMEKTAGSTIPNMETAAQNLSLSLNELPSITPLIPAALKPIPLAFSLQMRSAESVQLTEATRPMRRLYVDNLSAAASEKDLIECINKFLLSSGVNHIQGTQPCISCIIHKDNSQALLEFLTPEDASAALTFKGISFLGSSLNLRRPKDYAIITTGLPDKLAVAVDSVSSTVEDSLHKIFIGGVSKYISSKMLLEIARAFGAVKAFRFEPNGEINEPCAFLEYVDHSVTSKACAGLNNLKIGGKVLTAVLATPNAPSLEESIGKKQPPFYGIPEQARPLLENPTCFLKLKNLFDPARLPSMTEPELESTLLEDIRIECSR
ncbi:hypothetical protein M569_04059, partial [Genlisea aurea]